MSVDVYADGLFVFFLLMPRVYFAVYAAMMRALSASNMPRCHTKYTFERRMITS